MSATTRRLLWAFDFDGVVCDSAKELCLTAWAAARRLWPSHTSNWPPRPDDTELQAFYVVRPVVESGWEAIVINRCLQEKAYDPAFILQQYTSSLKERLLEAYGPTTPEEYAKIFHDTRMEWLTTDRQGWLREHGFYPHVISSIKLLVDRAPSLVPAVDPQPSAAIPTIPRPPVFIITTKGKEFTLELLKNAGLGQIPDDQVYGFGSGKKVDILGNLLSVYQTDSVVFIEDRLETQLGVMRIEDVRRHSELLLAGWGYNTEEEKQKATAVEGLTLLPNDTDFLHFVTSRLTAGSASH